MKKLFIFLIAVLISAASSFAQTKIKGKITDSKDGTPVSGATLKVRGEKNTILSKQDGTFEIVISKGKLLDVSEVGYSDLKMIYNGQSEINITLEQDLKGLTEVVVVGYGTQRRKDVTGNLASVKGSAIADKPVQTFDQALAGRAAGVQITIPSGVLNAPPVFRIRGTNSISLSSYPLIVVDGVPSFTENFSSTSAAGNALASINPNDIESIDIAKDAAATAIYGSRAANGVVFVTTKKGKSGKAKVSYNAWLSKTNAYRLPETLNADEYIKFKTSAVANNPGASAITYSSIKDANGSPINTKWSDYIYRQGVSHSHNLNVSGGNENTSYYFSTGYTKQEGIIKKNDFNRINVLFNLDSRISKMVTIGGKISFSNEKNLSATSSGSLSGEAYNTGGLGRLNFVLPPIIAPYNNDGSYNINGAAIGSANVTGLASLSYYNPVVSLDLNRSNSENNRIQSNAYLQVKPFDWLTIKTVFGIDYLLVDNDIFQTPVAGDGWSNKGYAWAGAEKYKTSLWTNTAQVEHKFGAKHHVNLLIGNEQQTRKSSGYGIQRQGLSDLAYTVVQAGFTTNNPADLFLSENYLLSGFSRLNYNFDGKYFLSGNIRQDEYSALGIKKGIFYGVSAGWEITKENLWEKAGLNKVFSNFRVRGSYGKVGNIGGIGDYSPYSTFKSGLYGGLSTLAFSSVGNPLLQWETSKKSDVGFSFGLFKNRLSGEFAYYKNNIDGLILYVPQAPSVGLPSNPPQNVGSMYNKGMEISLNATPIQQKDFTWSTSFNITLNKNLVTSLAPGLPNIQTATSGLETVNQTMEGSSLGYLFVVRTNGIDPGTGKRIFVNSAGTNVYYQYYAAPGTFNYSTQADGTVKYINPKGGASITQASDGVMFRNTQPKKYGGFDNTFRYKNFDLNVLFTYQYGGYLYYGSNSGLHDQRWWNNAKDVLTAAWSVKDDQNKLYAKPVYGDNVSNGSSMPLDINVFSSDFVKFKNLSVGYSLPKAIIEKMKITNFRFYISGQNLAVFTKYPGPDPEVSSNGGSSTSQGVDRNTAANARTILIGLNVGF